MKKNKALLAAIIGIAVVIIAIIAAMFATGKFTELRNYFEPQTTAPATTQTTLQTVAVSGRPKTTQPSSIVAAVYSEYSENSAQELANFEKLGFNTVIFDISEESASSVASLLQSAKSNNLYFGIRADISENSDYVTSFIEEFNVDFVILGGCDETLGEYGTKLMQVCKKIKQTDSLMSIGLEPVYTSKASDSLTNLISSGNADFVFVCHESGKDSAFEAAQTVWNEKTSPLWLCHDLKGLSSFTADKAAKTVELISKSADMSLCKALSFYPYNEIANASGAAAETVVNYIQKRDTYLLDKEFSITNYSKTSITVEQSTITFRGTSSPVYDLLCNGKKLNVAKTGDFSVDCELNVGKNTIKFEHKGKTYTYTVTYKIKLLKSVSPQSDISVPGEMMIEFSAVALKKANVSVTFNGKTYPMSVMESSGEEEDTSPDKESDFATFSATVTAPKSTASVQKLGKYKVTAKYSGLTESLNGANVSVAAKEIILPPEPTTAKPTTTVITTTEKPTETVISTENGSQINTSTSESKVTDTSSTEQKPSIPDSDRLQKYYYTENYGLGQAKICEIIDDYVETYPGNTTSTFSVPDCSPLLKGTVDYVKSTSTFDNETYYILASGVKVPLLREERLASGSEGKVTHVSIKDGYVMPKNSIKVISSKSANGKTVITLDMNRPVAFNAKLLGQTYGSYNGRPVTVSSLNCTALEFTFSDTVTAEGNISVSNSVCTGGKWTSNQNTATVTLTLELAQRGKFYGFHYEYDDNGFLVITVNHKPSSLNGYTIMLDPGHGGVDPGALCAVSSSSFGQEKQINLSIATKVKELLEADGANVVMTRTTDKWVCYTERNDAVRTHNPDMFIAIHCDSSTSASAMGTSAYYYRAYSQPLAKAVHTSIVNAYKNDIYKDEAQSVKDKVSRGANFYAFRVTRVEECPAILIEYGFVSNTNECQVLQSAQNRDILAAATVEGIKNYIASA